MLNIFLLYIHTPCIFNECVEISFDLHHVCVHWNHWWDHHHETRPKYQGYWAITIQLILVFISLYGPGWTSLILGKCRLHNAEMMREVSYDCSTCFISVHFWPELGRLFLTSMTNWPITRNRCWIKKLHSAYRKMLFGSHYYQCNRIINAYSS